jgi:hypothetical protein
MLRAAEDEEQDESDEQRLPRTRTRTRLTRKKSRRRSPRLRRFGHDCSSHEANYGEVVVVLRE